MRYLSICSGIEAASVAWHPLGWRPLAFSEIEAFPRAVLKHHYPDVSLHGDFTQLRDQPFIVDADLLVGGTPCQAFSIAGLRQSLSDDRGNLSLEFIRLADAIDDLRRDAGRDPAWVLWENVPGVFSTGDNAFGAFLGGLVGSDSPIVPRGRWQDAGVVAGPERVAAWRVLDAQYFGLAQRRKRVFVLARKHPRGWACADALLPIIDSLSGHPAPSRKAGEGAAQAASVGADVSCPNVSPSLKARENPDAGPDGVGVQADQAYTLEARAEVQAIAFAVRTNQTGQNGPGYMADLAPSLSADETPSAIAFALRGREGGTGHGTPIVPVAFQECVTGVREYADAGTLRAGGPGHDPVGTRLRIGSAVRRLTPRECERLQGFPDDFTLIPWRKGMAPDGPRYKALGNSMATHVMRYIGERIAAVEASSTEAAA